jgi:hypothetical protein
VAYTPELSYEASCTLRRIAWALEMPMTQAMEIVFEAIPKMLDRKKVCDGCRDKTKCHECAFNQLNRKEVGE